MTAVPRRTTVLVAVTASVAAGMVHAAAAGAHAEDRTLAALFALAAVLQIAWAAWVLARPGRLALGAGVVLHVGIAATWAVSRTVGIDAVSGLAGPQDVSFQDGVTVALELVAAAAVVLALRPAPAAREVWHPRAAALAMAVVAAVAVPAMAFPHTHDHAGDDQPVDVAAGGTLANVDGHSHDPAGAEVEPPEALELDPRLAGAPGIDAITPEQHQRAVELIDVTGQALRRFADTAAVQAAGYRSIGDGFTGFEHFVNYEFLNDTKVLDPAAVESLVFGVDPDGTKELVSGMYILPPGATMADVPDVAGPLTAWHDHQNLCWHEDGRLAGVLVDGECRPGGTFRATPPMLHVWVVEHPCGPFAGIDGSHGSGCEHDHS